MIKAGIAALVTIAGDFKITIQHTPISTSPNTGPRTATAVIKSSYKIAGGVNQPRLYYNVNGGSFNYLNPSYTNLDTFKFTIPGQPMNTTVKILPCGAGFCGNTCIDVAGWRFRNKSSGNHSTCTKI